jgi:hypothetical protein
MKLFTENDLIRFSVNFVPFNNDTMAKMCGIEIMTRGYELHLDEN